MGKRNGPNGLRVLGLPVNVRFDSVPPLAPREGICCEQGWFEEWDQLNVGPPRGRTRFHVDLEQRKCKRGRSTEGASSSPHIVELANGARALIRPIRPWDRERLNEGFESASQTSIFLRYLTPKPRLSSRSSTT